MSEEASSARHIELARWITGEWAAGRLLAEQVLPALAAILGDPATSRTRREILDSIAGECLDGFAPLERWLESACAADARSAFEHRRRGQELPPNLARELADLPIDAPLGWIRLAPADRRVDEALRLLRSETYIATRRDEAPAIAATVEAASREAASRLRESPPYWSTIRPRDLLQELRQVSGGGAAAGDELRSALDTVSALLDAEDQRAREVVTALLGTPPASAPADLDEIAVLAAIAEHYPRRTDRSERSPLLDWLLVWPTDRAAAVIERVCDEPWARMRAALVLTLRFGLGFGLDWSQWQTWLQSVRSQDRSARPADAQAAELLAVWYASQPGRQPGALAALHDECRRTSRPVSAEDFVRRWEGSMAAPERAALLGLPPVAPDEPPPPEPPSFWREHVQGFLAENWYLAAGVVMVVVGASLLAYFTWDRHWLLRYTIMPGLLGLFTFALAGTARWLEVRDDSLRGTGATLRGAAIGLLPVNFMAVALLARDPDVSNKTAAIPLMATVYLVLFDYGLRQWCQAVDARLGPLATSLLFLNGLVLLPALAGAVAGGRFALPLLVAGFHVGFFVLAAAVARFARDGLDAEATLDRRVPWFVGGTLVLTYLEVFAWVHGGIHWMPPAHVYAALVVLAGGLVLYAERRFLELRPEPGGHRAESFLGFAVLLLGVLMGADDPYTRILSLALAGAVWLYQASYRTEALHYWIAMVLLVLAGAAVGLLDAFPGPWLPGLGIALAVAVGATGSLAPNVGEGRLRATCRELQAVVLTVTAVVAVLAQWHFRSWPPATAAALGIVVLLFAWRARQDDSLRAVHTAAVVASLALPYLGFVDLEGRTLQGNTMVFGLALLAWAWIALVLLARSRLLLEARSTVLWMYGTFALAAMVLRVVFERGRAVDPLWYRSYPEYLGPLLMAAALLVATYTSRSLVPAAMASAIAVILLPELRANFQATFPRLAWGTGYGSAWNALLLVLVSFRLREWPRLRDLGEGDRFLGREPFPLRRFDHTLFTGPFLLTALFLAAKVDLWTLPQHFDDPVAPVRTGAAVVVTGAVWTLFAVYLREWRGALLGVHLGWAALLVGLPIVWEGLVDQPHWQNEMVAFLAILQGLELLYRRLAASRPWVQGLLVAPTRAALRFWSIAFALLIVGLLVTGTPLSEVDLLAAVVAAELAFESVVGQKAIDGWVLTGLAYLVLLAASAPGAGALADRLSVERGLTSTLSAIVAIQLVHVALEGSHAAYARLRPVLVPAQALATVLAAGLGGVGLMLALPGTPLSSFQHALLTGGVLLTARAHAAGPGALLGLLLGYELCHFEVLRRLSSGEARLDFLMRPWRLALFALVLAVLGEAGRGLAQRRPRWLAGPFAFPPITGPALPWIHVPAVLFTVLAAAHHTLRPDLRGDAVELAAPYLGALTLVLVGWSASWSVTFPLAAICLGLGNVHLVRLFFGARLRAGGLSEVHLVTLALGLTLVQGSVVRVLARRDEVTAWINRASLVVGALVLSLLSATYATHPNLEAMTPLRFATSGLMALAAGWYFRKAARHPARGEESYVELCEGLYHFGLAVAVWCAALLVPWFRRPSTALLALGLPALYFYARAELGRRAEPALARRYRHSASLLSFVLLGLYALRPVFQMTLFPETAIWTDHYHYYAVFAMGLGLLMMRLTGLGGTDWLAFYGGLSLMAGSFFGLTAWPGLSPFVESMPAAWCAVGLGHFWTLASAQRSPLRSLLQELSQLGDDDWIRLRAAWGRVVLVASQVAVLLGILDSSHALPHGGAAAVGGGQRRCAPCLPLRESLALDRRGPARDAGRACGLLRPEHAAPGPRDLGGAAGLGPAAPCRAPFRALALAPFGRRRGVRGHGVRPRALPPPVVGHGPLGSGRDRAPGGRHSPRDGRAARSRRAPGRPAATPGSELARVLQPGPAPGRGSPRRASHVADPRDRDHRVPHRPRCPSLPTCLDAESALSPHPPAVAPDARHPGPLGREPAQGRGRVELRGRPRAPGRTLRPASCAARPRALLRPLPRPRRGVVPRGRPPPGQPALPPGRAEPVVCLRPRPFAAPAHDSALAARIRRLGEPRGVLPPGGRQAELRPPARRNAPALRRVRPGPARDRHLLDAPSPPGDRRNPARGRSPQPHVRVARPRSPRLPVQHRGHRRLRDLRAHGLLDQAGAARPLRLRDPGGARRPGPGADVRSRAARRHPQPHPARDSPGHAGQRLVLRSRRRSLSACLQPHAPRALPGGHGPWERAQDPSLSGARLRGTPRGRRIHPGKGPRAHGAGRADDLGWPRRAPPGRRPRGRRRLLQDPPRRVGRAARLLALTP